MKATTKWAILAAILGIVALAAYGMLERRDTEGGPQAGAGRTSPSAGQPVTGRVTMIDLGATECVPCKMMAPIIEALKKEYEGKADIIFIDVWKDPPQAGKYGIRAIPTQIFFDRDGREAYRHTGFLDKRSIVDILKKLGAS